MRRLGPVLLLAVAACGDNTFPTSTCVDGWMQWGGGAAHDGASCATGQSLARALDDVVYDPFTPDEEADADGELIIHYQAPLVDGDDLFMMVKTGTYTPCGRLPDNTPDCTVDRYYRNTQVWSERAYRWDNGVLTQRWQYDSDWKPEPLDGFEPMFQPALTADAIAIPSAGGDVALVDRESGQLVRRIAHGAAIDPDTYVAGGVAAASEGTLYWTTLTLDHDNPFKQDAHGDVVAARPDGTVTIVPFDSLTTGAPAPTDMCEVAFDPAQTPRPWPPPPAADGTPAPPRTIACGTERPGINAVPAIGVDGRVYVVGRAHFASRYSYVVALSPDLAPIWAASLRGRLDDGCGVLTRVDGTDQMNLYDCRVGATKGVDLATNSPPAPQVDDESSSSPVATPDGGVIYGAYTGYNGARGHMMRFDLAGRFVGSFDFGWDTTPAVTNDRTGLHVILKDNHYGVDQNGFDRGPYFITHLDGNLAADWRFISTQTRSCVRKPDGNMECDGFQDHPNGFEWCINAPAVDNEGTVYGNSEDGFLYAVGADGREHGRIFLDQAEGAAYTPIALDQAGRIYAMNNGHLVIVGN